MSALGSPGGRSTPNGAPIVTALDTIVGKFRKGSPNIAAAFDEVQRRLGVLEAPPPSPPPPPPPAGSLDVFRHTFYPDSHGAYPGGETHSWHWLTYDSPNTETFKAGSANQADHGTIRWEQGGKYAQGRET